MTNRNIKVFGDNRGVVKGWWKGRSRNPPTNLSFRRIHDLCEESSCSIHTRYVASKLNPADDPSQGIYWKNRPLLPPIEIPLELCGLVVDWDHPLVQIEVDLKREHQSPVAIAKQTSDESIKQDAKVNAEYEHLGEELFDEKRFWDNQS